MHDAELHLKNNNIRIVYLYLETRIIFDMLHTSVH